MRQHADPSRHLHAASGALLAAALGVGLAGCLDLGHTAPAPSTARTTISHDWATFFSGHSSTAARVALLQNGSRFGSVIDQQASSALARGASAVVTKISGLTGSTATVHYTIYLGSTPVLRNQVGEALKLGGTWKVSDQTFCTLLAVEQVHTASCRAG